MAKKLKNPEKYIKHLKKVIIQIDEAKLRWIDRWKEVAAENEVLKLKIGRMEAERGQ